MSTYHINNIPKYGKHASSTSQEYLSQKLGSHLFEI